MGEILGVVGAYPHTDALFDKPIELSTGDTVVTKPYSWVAGGPAAVAARQIRAIPGWDWDFAELPVVNFLSSTELGATYRALPIFLTRRFVLNMLLVNRDVIKEPKDLEGKPVGIHYYGHTDTTWLRGILAEKFGVDLSKVTWVTNSEEQVPNVKLPPNLVHLPRAAMDQMLENGEIVADVNNPLSLQNVGNGTNLGPLWPDTSEVDKEWYDETGLLPILHTVVVKKSVFEKYPNFAKEVYAGYLAARDEAINRAESGVPLPAEDLRRSLGSGFPTTTYANSARPYLPKDPIPYGLEVNRKNIETLARMAREMHVIDWSPSLDDLFLPVD